MVRIGAINGAHSAMLHPHAGTDTPQPSIPRPRWLVLVLAMATSALLFAFVASPRTALFWYIFPLFGLGGCYLVQFAMKIAFQTSRDVAGAVVSLAVAAIALVVLRDRAGTEPE